MAINRYELVKRHNPVIDQVDIFAPLSVGNGEFAFSADITGLQSFPEVYQEGIPLCTQSQWGWHTTPAPSGINPDDYCCKMYDTYGRNVPYASNQQPQALYNWMRQNPHRLHLGAVGLEILGTNGRRISIQELHDIQQTLDLWSGTIISRFCVDGVVVNVTTVCDPCRDLIAVSVESSLLASERLRLFWNFPYGSPAKQAADWENQVGHRTEIIGWTDRSIQWLRCLDDDRYFVTAQFSEPVTVMPESSHKFVALATGAKLEFVTVFSPELPRTKLPSYSDVKAASADYWRDFWTTGGAVELSASRDSRALELERRIVLSQYLTAIQCSGTVPPQETGLTCNSWYGKPHLEMHFWHAAHFALWGRTALLERSLWWYRAILPKAVELARMQGYAGARWPKMVDHKGNNSPSPIAPLLIWQQPHPIFYAELSYRANPSLQTLRIYQEIVFQTAEFMASFAQFDEANDRYVLGPPVIPAQENHQAETTLNPTFELEYWVFGLQIAQKWQKRLGLPLQPKWEKVMAKMASLPQQDGVYLAHEKCPTTFTEFNEDHPSMLGAYGMLPGKLVDLETMRRTLQRTFADWQWEHTWGWDYPLVAMTAARLGETDRAIEALLMDAPKNVYLANGHNRQATRADLPLYLPGNGGLLLAVAMMAAGWDGGPQRPAQGFPADGSWEVRYEGLKPLP